MAQLVADGAGVASIENSFGLLRQVLGAAVEDRCIPRNPCDGVKLPKRQHADRGYLSTSKSRPWPPPSSATARSCAS